MPELESDLLQSLERMGGKVQWLEVSTRGRARGGAGILRRWLAFRGPTPAWEAGSLRSTRPLRGATHTCRSAPPGDPTASAWWCVSNRLQTTTDGPWTTLDRQQKRHQHVITEWYFRFTTWQMHVWIDISDVGVKRFLSRRGSFSLGSGDLCLLAWDTFTFLGEKVLGIFARHYELAWDTPQQLNDQCYMVYVVARGGWDKTGQTTDLLDKVPVRGPLRGCGRSSEVRPTARPPSLGGN